MQAVSHSAVHSHVLIPAPSPKHAFRYCAFHLGDYKKALDTFQVILTPRRWVPPTSTATHTAASRALSASTRK